MSDHLTERQHRDLIASLAAEALKDHVLTRRPDGSWCCGNPNGSSNYQFSIFFAPGMVAVWGDLGEFVLRHSDGDSLAWLLRAAKDGAYPDYLLGKIAALKGEPEGFHYAEAMAHLAERETERRAEIEEDEQDRVLGVVDPDETKDPELRRIRTVRAALEDVESEGDTAHQEAWWTAWAEQGDGDPPSCTGWSSGPLWLWQMALCFRRLHGPFVQAEGIPIGDGTPGDPPIDRVFKHDDFYVVRRPSGEAEQLVGKSLLDAAVAEATSLRRRIATVLDREVEVANEMVVNRHQMQNLLERFADLAGEALRISQVTPNGSIRPDFALEETGGGGVWVHDGAMPHPCDYACGAVHIERTPAKITAQMGTATIEFDREQDE